MNKIHCPKCKSDNVYVQSRRKFFFRSAVCLIIILFCFFLFYGIENEDFGPPVIIGVIGGLISLPLSFVFGIYYLVKGILQKQTNYKCGHCKNKFLNGLIVDHPPQNDPLSNIRKAIRT